MLELPPQPPHRCRECRLTRELCVCLLAPKAPVATRVVVVMHAMEWRKSSNTGHLARLALANAEVRLHGAPGQTLMLDDLFGAPQGEDSAEPARPLVLFPGFGARELTPTFCAALARPVTLIIPDGNWSQAKTMMRRVPALRNALPVALPGPALDTMRMRKNVFPDRMSTFEAIAQALGAIEGQELEGCLLDFFRRTVDRMLMLRGKIRANAVYGGLTS